MSETTPGETPVERRLRYLADDLAHDEDYSRAIAAGYEALALLREYTRGVHHDDGAGFDVKALALLARCTEGPRW